MTCIGAIKTIDENGKVTITMGSDSFIGYEGNAIIDHVPVKKIIKKDEILIGVAGPYGLLHIINEMDISKNKDFNKGDLLNSFIPELRSKRKDPCEDRNLLIACDGRLYIVTDDWDLIELQKFGAIGIGREYMIGALYATEYYQMAPMDTIRRLTLGLEAAHYSNCVRAPFQFEEITF